MSQPAIVLVRPQLGENVGATARAMLNCGLTRLRLVRPRFPWPSERAVAAASGADAVLAEASLHDTPAAALADLQVVYATTARGRDMAKPIVTAREAATLMRSQIAAGLNVGVMFGPERTGLENDDITLAETLVTIPLNPHYMSLNLAQAVLLVAYEWHTSGNPPPARADIPPAPKEELFAFVDRLEQVLLDKDFFREPTMRPTIMRNLRNMWQRAGATSQELRTLHGVVSALLGAKGPPSWKQ